MAAPDSRRSLLALLVLALVFTLGASAAKLYLQREHKPAWANANHEYDGFFAIDFHAQKAERIRDFMDGSRPSFESLARDLGDDMHPTSVAPLVLVAALGLLTGSISGSFIALSAAAWLALVAIAMALARRTADTLALARRRTADTGWRPKGTAADAGALANGTAADAQAESQHRGLFTPPALVAGILVAGHLLSARTAGQLYLDGFAALVAALVLWQLGPWRAAPTWHRSALLVLTLALGLFTKISCLPLLALPPLAVLVLRPATERRHLREFAGSVVVALLPLAAWALALSLLPMSDALAESRDLLSAWSLDRGHLMHFGQEMLLLFQAAPLLLFLRKPRATSSERLALLTIAVLALATWAFRLPPIARLYLPLLVPLAVFAAARLTARVEPRRLLLALSAWWLANAALTTWGLLQL